MDVAANPQARPARPGRPSPPGRDRSGSLSNEPEKAASRSETSRSTGDRSLYGQSTVALKVWWLSIAGRQPPIRSQIDVIYRKMLPCRRRP
jgi:hypothetical protein